MGRNRRGGLSWRLATALLAAVPALAVPTINIGMEAGFPAGPYLLELLETAAGENATSYFPLLDRIASGYFRSASTDEELYTSFLGILKTDGHIATPEALSTFNLALSLRTAAPRIEAHYQYYRTAVDSTLDHVPDCDLWVLLDGNRYCNPALTDPKATTWSDTAVELPFDRTLGAGKDAVLFADPTSYQFGPFHSTLSKAAARGELRYRLRYRRNEALAQTPLPVGGYGIELSLKRTDYIVIDDREAAQDTGAQQPLNVELTLEDEEEVSDLKPLSTSELASLGLKAASFIMQSPEPFDALVKLSQDIPKFSASIAAHSVSDSFLEEHQRNRALMAPGGINYMWINGKQLIDRQIEPFTIIDIIRQERKLLSGVRDLGFNGKQAVSLLGHDKISSAQDGEEAPRFDWTDRLEDGQAIIWLNDLEKDARYADFPKGRMSLLQRTYPGQIPPIAENIFHLVCPVDLANTDDLQFVGQIISLMRRGIPVRFGIVPLVSSEDNVSRETKIAYQLASKFGQDALVDYVRVLLKEADAKKVDQQVDEIIKRYSATLEISPVAVDALVEEDGLAQRLGLAQKWSRRLNANTTPRPAFVDGSPIPRGGQWMQAVSTKLAEDLQAVQMGVLHGTANNFEWLPDIFLEKASANRNIYISPPDPKDLVIIDVNKAYGDNADLFDSVPVLESQKESTKESWAVLTVVADLDTEKGRDLLVAALAFRKENLGVRLDIVHNPNDGTNADASKINSILKAQLPKLEGVETTDGLVQLLDTKTEHEEDSKFNAALQDFLAFASVTPGSRVLILNGRVVGPILPQDSFSKEDFQQLRDFEYANRIKPVYEAIEDLGLSEMIVSPLSAAKVTSVTALASVSDLPEGIFESAPSVRTNLYDEWEAAHTAIEVGNAETSSLHIVGLLNPLSEKGQRWAPILKCLSTMDGIYMKLFLNPKEKIDELPVKRFYRYVLEPRPSFGSDGNLKAPHASFKSLPSEALLTAAINVPPAWLVAPKASVHDLDNIKLSSVKGGDVEATYELKHILIEGHSREGRGGAPRGAQLVLGTELEPLLTDTIIMSNLGFFQFKANPGYYNIHLKEGRSAEVFEIESIGAQGYQHTPSDASTNVALMDFQGTTLYPRLKRKAGMEDADVLETGEAEENILSKGFKLAESFFGGGAKKDLAPAEEHAEINIFSVASGHLYERMLNIMMVSVMKHTKHTVKFWFIEQFLSPSFKDFIPHLAEEYGFRYEMVTYKWPHWLRQQREKQREIWGYKILFLDVLFPLSLEKVIFVDADQIVRTDMIDLVRHDLDGAPYGFTPMCDSRVEMEGFRFWKQGYWKNYLRGLPYHISALYVVDLRRFRELAAGDRLRQQYHSLSADPNSLSNLDQDLPNNMQFQIPIHSLPQDWLWCETWCSDESLSGARTIDLCNNPETKEPKLDRARRQVPEWTTYDEEIAALDRKRRQKEGAPQEETTTSTTSGVTGVNTKSRRMEDEGVHTKDEL